MKYPTIRRQSVREVGVPKLSGGINLRDSLTGVRDNQLTDCVNMWYKGGTLRTRPALVTSEARLNILEKAGQRENIGTKFHSDIKVNYEGKECVCATYHSILIDDDGNKTQQIGFEFQASDKIFKLPSIENITSEENLSYFLADFQNTLYCYISNCSIYKLDYDKQSDDYQDDLVWENVSLEESHIPTVMTHCKALNGEITGTQLDSYNALTNSFKVIYSTVNYNALVNGVVSMEYPMPSACSSFKKITFKAEHTKLNGTVTKHTVECNFNQNKNAYFEQTESIPSDNLYMYVKKNKGKVVIGFASSKNISTSASVGESDFVEDNLTITAIIYDTENLNLKKVFGMTKSIWFGGTSGGIYSGSRLFLGANNQKDEKSLLIWSDLNNPLYFPENCYAYVGNKSYAVTAFGRQDNKLIVFKENEIYYTNYVYNGNISADYVVNQTIIDYQANIVSFPLVLINGLIGCDCPDSVQMCRNRLVWASSEGSVFTLYKTNQYDEHTVYDISEMIKPMLKQYKDRLKTASSADFDGHYILFLNDCALVADYNSYGYQYIYSYSKTDDANALLPWYYWDFSFLKSSDVADEYTSADICVLKESLLMRAYFNASDNFKSGFVGFEMKEDSLLSADKIFNNDFLAAYLKICDSPIICSATTKLFEPGNGVYNIDVESLILKVGSNNGADIDVELLSEKGCEKSIIKSRREFKKITDTDFTGPKRVYPTTVAVLKLGIRLKCEGLLIIDGISLRYRLLGGAKQ